jgi:hypothetical protein
MYRKVNDMFGDVIKVTPSSKIVGDMAMFMVQNNLQPEDVYKRGQELTFPQGVVDFFKGMIGQPHGGFPEKLQKIVLKGEKPITCRPGRIPRTGQIWPPSRPELEKAGPGTQRPGGALGGSLSRACSRNSTCIARNTMIPPCCRRRSFSTASI